VELGVCEAISTTAFCIARPQALYAYDYHTTPMQEELVRMAEAEGVNLSFCLGDTRKVDISPCDLLFIDTLHQYRQLLSELVAHAGKARKYMLLHDTESFKDKDEAHTGPGMWAALTYFLEWHPEWYIKEHFTNNNGLTVLERTIA
jgi:hypothetical protein